MYLKEIQRVIIAALGLLLCGCDGFETSAPDSGASPTEVVLGIGRSPQTRTVYDDDTKSFAWQNEDKVYVWAKSASGSYALENTAFSLLARPSDESSAYFTATLASPMEEGTYSYYVAYPAPSAVSGTTATFTVPAVQDGTAPGANDILLSQPVQGSALQALEEGVEPVSKDVMSVKMKHLLHYLRFYIPEGCNTLGEPVSSIEFTMPQAIAGQLNVDVTDASTAALSGGVSTMTLKLAEALADGSSTAAVVGIVPPSAAYSDADRMTVKLVSENKWATVSPSLNGRTFSAGHITSVPLRPEEAREKFSLKFTLASNNLGEDPQKITLTLADGSAWPDGTSGSLLWEGSNGGVISVGDAFCFKTADEAAFKALSSKVVNVSYESESAIVSAAVTVGDLSSVSEGTCSLNCPYLFFEDFSTVGEISSDDAFDKGSIAGSKDAVVFNGWSAARVGAKAQTAIRLAARRQTSWEYPARADSPFLSLKNGVTVNLEVQFNYSMNRQEYSAFPRTNPVPKAGQTVYLGFITTSSYLKSGDETGTFPNSFPLNETTGSYSNINHLSQTTLSNVKAPLRLSWRTVPDHHAGTHNSTCWLYIDNIKVKIKK